MFAKKTIFILTNGSHALEITIRYEVLVFLGVWHIYLTQNTQTSLEITNNFAIFALVQMFHRVYNVLN